MNTFVFFNECVLSHASQSTTADLVPKVCAGGVCKIIGGIPVNGVWRYTKERYTCTSMEQIARGICQNGASLKVCAVNACAIVGVCAVCAFAALNLCARTHV